VLINVRMTGSLVRFGRGSWRLYVLVRVGHSSRLLPTKRFVKEEKIVGESS